MGSKTQTAHISLGSGKTMTLQGGWDSAFTTHSASTTTTLDTNGGGRVILAGSEQFVSVGTLYVQDLALTVGMRTKAPPMNGGVRCPIQWMQS